MKLVGFRWDEVNSEGSKLQKYLENENWAKAYSLGKQVKFEEKVRHPIIEKVSQNAEMG